MESKQTTSLKEENPNTNGNKEKPQMGHGVCCSSESECYPSILPTLLPLMVDQNIVDQALPISLNGDFSNGVSSNLQIVDASEEISSSSTLSPKVFQPHGWASSIIKSPRSKRNFTRKFTSSSSSSWKPPSFTTTYNSYKDIYCITTPDGKKLKFILQKELKNSDVNALGRIVLPKRSSEASLPRLLAKEGIQIAIRDVGSTKIWRMRYRYWPNNKSRMYVLENAGDFIRRNELKNGDFITIYKDENNQFYISCEKTESHSSIPVQAEHPSEVAMFTDGFSDKIPNVDDNSSSNKGTDQATLSQLRGRDVGEGGTSMTQLAMEIDEPSYSKDMVMEGYGIGGSGLMDIKDCDFSDLERIPDFDDYDFSLYDNPMGAFMDGTDDTDDKGEDNVLAHK